LELDPNDGSTFRNVALLESKRFSLFYYPIEPLQTNAVVVRVCNVVEVFAYQLFWRIPNEVH
jgi:hypothetical protein